MQSLWNNELKSVSNGILFLPTNADVAYAVDMMKYWGIKEAVHLRHIAVNATHSNISMESSGILGMVSNHDSSNRKLYVTSVSGSRGLHIKDIDVVFVLTVPDSMDEYLHMAGRTGRYGNQHINGTVVSIANYDEYKRLRSWRTPLQIDVQAIYR